MLPILNAKQIKEADAYTIAHEPVTSIDLMERVSKAFVSFFMNRFADKNLAIAIYAGTGNNGGDGLAIARLLHQHGYRNLSVKIARFSNHVSPDFEQNLVRLKSTGITIVDMMPGTELPEENACLLIDALLGSGLNKPLANDFARLVKHLNSLERRVIAVDIPTGFIAEGELSAEMLVFKADLVISFQLPKLNFLLPESAAFLKCWEVMPIGLDEGFIHRQRTESFWVEESDIRSMLKRRLPFEHKGSFGHSLLIAGQPETMGAALLSASAAVYAGAGLTTVAIPKEGTTALNTYMPEIMLIQRNEQNVNTVDWNKYQSVGIGPGLGNNQESKVWLERVIRSFKKSLVIDADGLNILAENPDLLDHLPINTVLTPHMKEFDRLFGEHHHWWTRLQTLRQQAHKRQIYIILKNRYSICATSEGNLYFNPTGNPAMSTGGMGDVLTGIITSLCGQGYNAFEACLIGMYTHGKAGDELALPTRLSTVLPSKLAAQLPITIGKLSS